MHWPPREEENGAQRSRSAPRRDSAKRTQRAAARRPAPTRAQGTITWFRLGRTRFAKTKPTGAIDAAPPPARKCRQQAGRHRMKFALGQSVPRTEDPRLLTGRGRYADDFDLPRHAHGHVLRSPHAHARIRCDRRARGAADAGRARGAHRRRLGGGEIRRASCRSSRASAATARRCSCPTRPALAKDRAMLVGDPVAFVVAETVELAKDAAERIAVEYEPLPSVTATDQALAPGAPKLWDEMPRQRVLLLHPRRQARGRGRLRQGASRHAPEARLQPHHRGDDGAARLHRRVRPAARAATRSISARSARTAPAPTWRGASSTSPRRSFASSPAMSAAASA